MRRAVACLSVLVLAAPTLVGQCRLIDVNASIETPFNGNPEAAAERPGGTNLVQGFVKCGAYWYFVATTGAHGEELWRTDATTAGTVMVKDILPGPDGSRPRNLICCLPGSGPALLFFQADNGTQGVELWVSDGTEAGTTLVADIWSGGGSSDPQSLECLNGRVCFSAIDGDTAPAHGRELWCSDGTAAGTVLVSDIEPGPASGAPKHLKRNIAGTQVYFNAFQTATGRELWVTGGTAATTGLLLDIEPGAVGSDPEFFVNHNGTTLFNAFTSVLGRELWKTNGTVASTVLVSDIVPGPFPGDPQLESSAHASCGNRLFFSALHPVFGFELYYSDGTAAGTNFAGDIGGVIPSNPDDFVSLGPSKVLFTTQLVPQLFVFDCATDQFSAVDQSLLSPSGFVEIGGRVVFAATGGLGRELYVTDGTSASLAVDINPVGSSSPTAITPIDASRVILAAEDPTGPGRELWISDGTAAGTSLLKDIDPDFTTASGEVSELSCPFGRLVFAANDGASGVEPFTLDAAGAPVLIKDIDPGPGSSAPRGFTSCWLNGRVLTFFVASTPATGLEPWVSDGTAAGTILLGDLVAGGGASNASQFTCCDDQVFFVAANELWVTDGTAFGTRVIELDPSSAARPDFLICCKGTLYFSAFTSAAGRELMTSDGTESGTRVIRDIVAGSTGSAPAEIVCCGDRLYFVATEANGTELWTSDGTAAGTVMAANIAAGAASSSPNGLTCCEGRVFFQANGVGGAEPYVSDGTPAGTVLLKDVTPGSSGSSPAHFTCCPDGNGGNRVTFVARNGIGEWVLWRTNGTPAGTVEIKNLGPVLAPGEFSCCGTRLYFQVADPVIGRELWVSDGSANGTRLFCDIDPEGSSDPTDLVCCGGKMYLAATTTRAGRELIVIDAPGATVEHVGTGCAPAFATMTATPPILGGTVTFSGTCAPGGHIGVLVFDAKGPPYTLPFLFADGCSVMPNILSPTFAVLPGQVLGPNWTYPLDVPNEASLQGACLALQSWWIDLSTVFPMATSNSVLLGLSQF